MRLPLRNPLEGGARPERGHGPVTCAITVGSPLVSYAKKKPLLLLIVLVVLVRMVLLIILLQLMLMIMIMLMRMLCSSNNRAKITSGGRG